MSRVKSLKNISDEMIRVKHEKGFESIVPPKAELVNVNITNEKELEGKVSITFDLTEVRDVSGKIQLND